MISIICHEWLNYYRMLLILVRMGCSRCCTQEDSNEQGRNNVSQKHAPRQAQQRTRSGSELAAAWQELEERAIELEEEAQKASIAKPYDQLDVSGKLEIEQIDLALTKITIGEYGVCESCGDDISPKRLAVLPWARLCVDCARDYEKMHKTLPRTPEAVGAARIPDEYQGLTNEQIVHAIYERLQSDERIDTEELKIAVRKGVLYLDGAVPGEFEHEIIHQMLTDVMGFTAIVDHLEITS